MRENNFQIISYLIFYGRIIIIAREKEILKNGTKAIIHALVEKSIKRTIYRVRGNSVLRFSVSRRRKAFYVTRNTGLEVSRENYKLFMCTRDFHSEELRVPSFRWSSGIVKGRSRTSNPPISRYIAASDTNLDVTGSEIAFPRQRAKINSKIMRSRREIPFGSLMK